MTSQDIAIVEANTPRGAAARFAESFWDTPREVDTFNNDRVSFTVVGGSREYKVVHTPNSYTKNLYTIIRGGRQ